MGSSPSSRFRDTIPEPRHGLLLAGTSEEDTQMAAAAGRRKNSAGAIGRPCKPACRGTGCALPVGSAASAALCPRAERAASAAGLTCGRILGPHVMGSELVVMGARELLLLCLLCSPLTAHTPASAGLLSPLGSPIPLPCPALLVFSNSASAQTRSSLSVRPSLPLAPLLPPRTFKSAAAPSTEPAPVLALLEADAALLRCSLALIYFFRCSSSSGVNCVRAFIRLPSRAVVFDSLKARI
nr:unnamed protein product [Digitaria exilis]